MPPAAEPTDARTEAPPYLRIVAEIRQRIAAGALRPGDRVPSTRQITQEWGVAMATATKALTALRQLGLVQAQPGVGTVVAPEAAELAATADGGAQSPAPATVPPRATLAPPATSAPRRSPKPREARGGEPGLTRERIVRAAVAVADADGLEALTMRRVATELGVATMALYRHVGSKEELLDLAADTVIGSVPLPADTPPGWRPRLAAIARLQWSLYREHPWLAHTISLTRPTPLPNALLHGEWVIAALGPLNLSPRTRLYTHIMMFAFVRGLAVNLEMQRRDQAGGLTDEEWMDSREGELTALLAGGRYPSFGAMLADFDAMPEADSFDFDLDQLFEFALERVLDGLAALIDPATRQAP